jgi:uncharacterized protein YbjT (DUF2867 family)
VKVILFGSTGMVGQGVLRECLRDPDVEGVLTIVRKPTGRPQAKVREIVHENFLDFSPIASALRGYDACFFCLGVSSAGMKEADYRRVTYGFTLAAAQTLVRESPDLTFVYVSGAGTDTSERGRTMWARVKGTTENALAALPFRAAYMFRPAFIQPAEGITSKTQSYRVFYRLLGPLLPVLKTLFPRFVTTTGEVGRAMLEVARHGGPKRVLENADIVELGRR